MRLTKRELSRMLSEARPSARTWDATELAEFVDVAVESQPYEFSYPRVTLAVLGADGEVQWVQMI